MDAKCNRIVQTTLAQILSEELSDLDQEREQTLFSGGGEKAKDYLRRRLIVTSTIFCSSRVEKF
jgi:hypothetical protein